LIAAVGAISLLLSGCAETPDHETRILNHIETMTLAIESGDIDDFMAPVADDFLAADGRIDRRALGLLARRERLARDAVRVRRVDTRVELVTDRRAVAVFNALATGGSGLLPEEGRLWRVETGWRLDSGRWRLISARWEPVLR
jgi:chorismate mutase